MIGSVSVDLDGLSCYAAIHGLDPRALDDRARRAVPEVALERLCELFDALPVRATLFVIGSELRHGTRALRAAAAAGHEIGSHSFAHDYALSRRSEGEIDADLAQCEAALAEEGFAKPRGFRAPGYTLSQPLLEVLAARGYLYDSSLLPSPAYYAVKAAAIGLHALRGRASHSILGAPGQLFGARRPHRLRGLRELPVATTPLLRLPVIGTTVLAAPWLARWGRAGGHLNLELHGIDALDESDVPRALARVQPGLATPAAEKLKRLRALLRALPEWCTLEDAALRLLPSRVDPSGRSR